MWIRLVAVGIVVAGLQWVTDEAIPSYVVYPLVGGVFGVWAAFRRLATKVLRPAWRPPPPTGSPLARAGWLTGSIGTTPLRNHLWVTVYPDRLVVRVPMVGTRTVMADQLGPISVQDADRPEIRIEHTASGLDSPIMLRLPKDHPLLRAIPALTGN